MAATHPLPARRALAGAFAALMVVPLAAGCAQTVAGSSATAKSGDGAGGSSPSSTPTPVSKVKVTSNVEGAAGKVAVNRMVKLDTAKGTFRTVSVRTQKGDRVAGALNNRRTSWHAKSRLEPGMSYVVHAVAADSRGIPKKYDARFATQDLTLDQQTFASVSPLDGRTVGVGMPVMIHFDVPVTNHKLFQQHMHVTTSSGQKGSFYWLDDQNVHYRPKTFWKPGSKVNVAIDVNSLDAGSGVYGQKSRNVSFTVGRSMVSKVDMKADLLRTYRDGRLIKTIPVTGGKSGFTTRSGTKVIVQKYRHKRMNSETIGIDPNSANGYDLSDVEYAMRLTFSGEFLHAAPWSVGSQGHANVSHGCTGMSTANAQWLYDNSIVGDPVVYTGTDKYMTLTNGYGDWNLSWADWQKGSAL